MQLNRIYFHIRLLFFFFPPLPSTSIDSTLPLQTIMEKKFPSDLEIHFLINLQRETKGSDSLS